MFRAAPLWICSKLFSLARSFFPRHQSYIKALIKKRRREIRCDRKLGLTAQWPFLSHSDAVAAACTLSLKCLIHVIQLRKLLTRLHLVSGVHPRFPLLSPHHLCSIVKNQPFVMSQRHWNFSRGPFCCSPLQLWKIENISRKLKPIICFSNRRVPT